MLSAVRTTVTLDPDTEQLLRRRMTEEKVSFKKALNDAIRAGLGRPEQEPFRTKTFNMGPPKVDLTHTGRLLGEMDDAEFLRKDAKARLEFSGDE
jgi:hypothetical protein